MLSQDKRTLLWSLVRKAGRRLHIELPEHTYIEFWEYMRTIEGDIRYVIIEHYNLNDGFFFRAYEEIDLKPQQSYIEKIKEMYEDYFSDVEGWEEILFIDLKTKKAYLVNKIKSVAKSTGTETIKFSKRQVK